jgi:RRXRR protein
MARCSLSGSSSRSARQISERSTARRAFRRRRRNANLRYRSPRFSNPGGERTGWLPPNLRHRIETCMSWVKRSLADTGLPVESAPGGRTKFNRTRLGIPKRHALDAACVGEVEAIAGWNTSTLDEGATAGLLPDQRGPVRVPSRLSHTNQARSRLPDR